MEVMLGCRIVLYMSIPSRHDVITGNVFVVTHYIYQIIMWMSIASYVVACN